MVALEFDDYALIWWKKPLVIDKELGKVLSEHGLK
jgi:hypothetical protein